MTWERILSKLNVVISSIVSKKLDWKTKPKEFLQFEPQENLMGLKVKYRIVSKELSLVNFEKVEYELDWIIKISIWKLTEPKRSHSKSLSPEVAVNSADQDISVVHRENTVVVIDDSQPDESHSEDDIFPMEKRAKIDASTPSYSLRSTPKKDGTLDKWLTKPKAPQLTVSNPNITKRKNKGNEGKRKLSERSPALASRSPLESIDPQQMQRLEEFNEKQHQEELRVSALKEELKDLEILNCKDSANDVLKQLVISKKDEILSFYNQPHNSRSKVVINGNEIDYVIMTSSQVITEKQHIFIMKEVEKLRDEPVRSTKENISSNVVMPFLIIELFRQVHDFSFEEAADRIKRQVEKFDLFNAHLYDSF